MQTEIVLEVHERLRVARQRAGLDQDEMAEIVGVHRGVISRYENGHSEPSLSALVKWADVADVSLDWLCARRDSNPQPSDLYPAAFIRPVLELWNTYKLVRSLVEKASRRSPVSLESRLAIAAAPAPAPGRDRDVVLWPSDNRGAA